MYHLSLPISLALALPLALALVLAFVLALTLSHIPIYIHGYEILQFIVISYHHISLISISMDMRNLIFIQCIFMSRFHGYHIHGYGYEKSHFHTMKSEVYGYRPEIDCLSHSHLISIYMQHKHRRIDGAHMRWGTFCVFQLHHQAYKTRYRSTKQENIYIYTYIYMYIHICIMFIYIYIYVYIYMYICMYI